jgi:hypothetical protein
MYPAFRGVERGTRDTGRDGFIDEYAHSRENTRFLIRRCWHAPTSVSLLKVVDRSSGLRWKSRIKPMIRLVTIGTRAPFSSRRLSIISSCVYFFVSIIYHGVSGCLVKLLSWSIWPWFFFPDRTCLHVGLCIMNKKDFVHLSLGLLDVNIPQLVVPGYQHAIIIC